MLPITMVFQCSIYECKENKRVTLNSDNEIDFFKHMYMCQTLCCQFCTHGDNGSYTSRAAGPFLFRPGASSS